MSFFTGSAKSQATQKAAVSGLQLQSSAYGKALPIVYGGMRIAPNLLWYGDFIATAHQASSAGGGKGGGTAATGGKGGGGGGTSYTYNTALVLGLCEGPIVDIGYVYANKSTSSAGSLGFSFFRGNHGQSTWGHLTSAHRDQAIGYSGVAYVAASSYALGDNPHLPNHNFEVYGKYAYSIRNTLPDADPSLVMYDLLSNSYYGAGFPVSRIASLSLYQSYCLASGLWFSAAFTEQEQASSILDALAIATNSAFVWSSGMLRLVPYGDQAISGNGYSYTPPVTPLFDITDDDYLLPSRDSDPVQMTRKRPSDRLNAIRVECYDRHNSYNPAIVEAKDQALVESAGLRTSPSFQRHMFADPAAARISAQLELQRQAVRNIYSFTLDQRFVLLDPMDIITLTDEKLGLERQWVRITEITENDDGSLLFTAEEYLQGSGNAAAYDLQVGQGYNGDANIAPGNINEPILFEPTAQLEEASEVWAAISGGLLWGGCDVWISNDSETYRYAGRVTGSARMGALTAPFHAVGTSANGQTVDSINTISVDLSESRGELISTSQSNATALATLCYVDGEFIAYRDATLTGPHAYNLGWTVRGAYDSPITSHGTGSAFARLDNSILRIPFMADAVGSTIYCKFVSFNLYGSGQQALADVNPYAYTIKGTAYASPPKDVTSLTTVYMAGITQLNWREITDFRAVLYEVRKGAAWESGQTLGQVAHPPFTAQGNGTYWVAALCQPLAGIKVYSKQKESIIVTGAQITSNVIVEWDEEAAGWTGTTSGSAVAVGGIVRTSGAGNILDDLDYLVITDLFNYGYEGNGTYEIPTSHIIDIGRVAPCSILINWSSLAQHFDNNILAVEDLLGYQDVLDFAASGNTDIYPEISLSQDGSIWSGWQKHMPGVYSARAFKARMQLKTLDPLIVAILQEFTFAVDVPDRNDHYVNLAVASGGTSVTFIPDGSASAAAFNGGPQGSPTAPHIQVTILNAVSGDVATISAISLSSCTVQVLNGGVGVARLVNMLVQGY